MSLPHLNTVPVIVISLLCPILVAHGAPAKAAKPKPIATNAAPAVVQIPQSNFSIPSNPREGRDPFFPDSIRPYSGGIVKSREPVPTVNLVLNGISADFIMVNGKTVAKGEELLVTTPGGRVKIRCLEINLNTDSAVVEVNGQRQELRRKDH